MTTTDTVTFTVVTPILDAMGSGLDTPPMATPEDNANARSAARFAMIACTQHFQTLLAIAGFGAHTHPATLIRHLAKGAPRTDLVHRTAPFLSLSRWDQMGPTDNALFLEEITGRHLSRAMAGYLAQKGLDGAVRAELQKTRALIRLFLRLTGLLRARLRTHFVLLRDLRAARASLIAHGSFEMTQAMRAHAFEPEGFRVLERAIDTVRQSAGMSAKDLAAMNARNKAQVVEVVESAIVHLTGYPR